MFSNNGNILGLSIKENTLVGIKGCLSMAVPVYDYSWKDYLYLMQQLKKHNSKGMRLQKLLSYMKRDFSHYSLSLIKLNRRLSFFSIYRHDKNVALDEVTEAIKKACKRPGQLSGYRANISQNKKSTWS